MHILLLGETRQAWSLKNAGASVVGVSLTGQPLSQLRECEWGWSSHDARVTSTRHGRAG